MKPIFSIIIAGTLSLFSYTGANAQLKLNQLNSKLIDLTVRDQLSPPIASRMIAYCNLSFYMAYHVNDSSEKLLSVILKNRNIAYAFTPVGAPTDTFNVANYVFLKTAMRMAYDTMFVYNGAKNLGARLSPGDKEFAVAVLSIVNQLMDKDGFKERTSLKRYEEKTNTLSYRLTPPTYRLPIEPHWETLKPFFLSDINAFQFTSKYDKNSLKSFDKANKKIYKKSKRFGNTQKRNRLFLGL